MIEGPLLFWSVLASMNSKDIQQKKHFKHENITLESCRSIIRRTTNTCLQSNKAIVVPLICWAKLGMLKSRETNSTEFERRVGCYVKSCSTIWCVIVTLSGVGERQFAALFQSFLVTVTNITIAFSKIRFIFQFGKKFDVQLRCTEIGGWIKTGD